MALTPNPNVNPNQVHQRPTTASTLAPTTHTRYTNSLSTRFVEAAVAQGHTRRNDFNDWSEGQDGVGKFQLQTLIRADPSPSPSISPSPSPDPSPSPNPNPMT